MKLVRTIAENYRLPYYTLSPTYSVCPQHGYIAGEVYECPHCHQKTEVYSRITGYYRPVQNWNDGKTQEWHDRKTYDYKNSKLKKDHVCPCEEHQQVNVKLDKPILFVQNNCPNCKMAELMLGKNKFEYREVNAMENSELATKLGIKLTPTLVVPGETGDQVYENASNIRRYIESEK